MPWLLDDHLDAADRAERDGAPAAALDAYRAALALWRGEPFVDVAVQRLGRTSSARGCAAAS